MDTTIDINAPVSDRFSWRRVGLVARFYYPRLRTQIIIYPLTGILLTLLSIFAAVTGGSEIIWPVVSSIVGFMLMFGPVSLGSRKGLEIETTFPATGAEKSTFIILYAMIGIPLLLLLPAAIGALLTPADITADFFAAKAFDMRRQLIDSTYGMVIFDEAAPMITCLWAVMAVKKNRVLMGIVWAIACNFAIGIAGGIYGIYIVFTTGLSDGRANLPMADPEAITGIVMDSINPFIMWISIVLAIYVIFALIKTVQCIKNRQL